MWYGMVWYGMVWYGMDWHVKVFVWKYLFLALQHSFPYQTEELVHNCFKYNTSSPNPMMVANVPSSSEEKQLLLFYGLCSARHGMGRDDQTERRRWEGCGAEVAAVERAGGWKLRNTPSKIPNTTHNNKNTHCTLPNNQHNLQIPNKNSRIPNT